MQPQMQIYLPALFGFVRTRDLHRAEPFRASGQLVSALAGRLQASQKNVSPYCEVTALKPSGRRSTIIRSPSFDCERRATPVDAQFGHLKISVQCSETVIEDLSDAGSILLREKRPQPGGGAETVHVNARGRPGTKVERANLRTVSP